MLPGMLQKFKNLMVENELGGKLSDAYKLTKCSAGESGYSFGLVQYDLSVSSEGRNVFRSAMASAGAATVFIGECLSRTSSKTSKLTIEELGKINGFLSSAQAKAVIDSAFEKTFEGYQKVVDNFIKSWSSSESKKKFFEDDFVQLFLLDYNNQFNIGKGQKMDVFFSGQQTLDKIMIVSYMLNTKYALDKNNQKRDLIRRLCNVVKYSTGTFHLSVTEKLKLGGLAAKDKDLKVLLDMSK